MNAKLLIKHYIKFLSRRLRKIKLLLGIKVKKINIYLLVILLAAIVLLLIGFDSRLRVTEYEISSSKLSENFENFVIIQISDLHCKAFGKGQIDLIKRIKKESPQLIVLTGDMFDYQRWNYNNIKSFLEGITKIAPVYAVTGNHEYDDEEMFYILKELYHENGITLLNDEAKQIYVGDEYINLYGMYFRDYFNYADKILEAGADHFNVLLYHDPTQFNKLLGKHYDLILSGHTHGGVIRLPFLGGVIGTQGDFFPQYDHGQFKYNGTSMITSAGLGETEIPRIFNRPEIVKIILKKG